MNKKENDFLKEMDKDITKILRNMLEKEDCKLFVETKNGKSRAGIQGSDIPLLLNAVGLVQQLLDQTGFDKDFFDWLYSKTTTKEYGRREWKWWVIYTCYYKTLKQKDNFLNIFKPNTKWTNSKEK